MAQAPRPAAAGEEAQAVQPALTADAQLKADEALLKADKLAHDCITANPLGVDCILGAKDDIDVWLRRLNHYIFARGIQSEPVKYSIYRRALSEDVQEMLRQFSSIDSSKVGTLLDRRDITNLVDALKLVTAHDTTLVATVLSVAKDLQSKSPLMDVPARVKKAMNLITSAIKSFKEDDTARDVFQLAVSSEVFREFADSPEYKPHGYNQIERFVLDKMQKQRGEREAKEVKSSVRPSEPKPSSPPSPKKTTTMRVPSSPSKKAPFPSQSAPAGSTVATKEKPDGWTPRADTAEQNRCPICNTMGHYVNDCPRRRADRASRSKATQEKKEGSTAQFESPGYFISAAISVPEGTRLQPLFVDNGSYGNLVDATFLADHLHLQSRKAASLLLKGVGRQTSTHVADIAFTLFTKKREATFRVCELPSGVNIILGGEFLFKHKIDVLTSEMRLRLNDEGGAKVPLIFREAEAAHEHLLALVVTHSPSDVAPLPEELVDFIPPFNASRAVNEALQEKGLALVTEYETPIRDTTVLVNPSAMPTDDADTPPVIVKEDINIWPGASADEHSKIINWVEENADMFFNENAKDALGRMKGFTHSMPMDKTIEDNPPLLDGAQHFSPKKLSVALTWLREGLSRGRVEAHAGRVVFLNRLVIVETFNPITNKIKHRICLDLRKVNEHLKKLPYPQKRVRDVLARLKGAQRASELDNRWSYEQVSLRPEDRAKVCFWLDGRVYHMCVMTFGDKNAPFMMQYIMDTILHEARDVADTLIDNTLAFTTEANVDDHLRALTRIANLQRPFNTKWGLAKCKFFYPDIETLGHVVSGEGTLPSDSRVKAWRAMAPPTTAESLLTFLQALNFWREYIPAYAEFSSELRALAAATPFQWTPAATATFKELLRLASAPPLLVHPDVDKEFFCRTDASQRAIAGVLFQPHTDRSGKPLLRPVAFVSRALNKHEVNYATTSLELLAAKDVLERTRLLHEGCPALTLETDHAALVFMANNPNLGNGRSARHILVVRMYATTLIHRKGKSPEMRLVDAMTRDPNYMLTAEQITLIVQPAALVKLGTFASLPAEQRKDPITLSLIKAVESGAPADEPAAEALRQQFRGYLAVLNGILLHVDPARGRAKRNARYWVPDAMRAALRDAMHADGHFKGDKLYRKAADLYFFPGMYTYMAARLDCTECSLEDAPPKHLTGHLQARQVGFPRKLVAFDHLSIGGLELFTVVDVFTFYPWAFVVDSLNTEDTVRALLNISLEDPPRAWTCDNYATFTSGVMDKFANLLGIKLDFIPDGWPQMNPDERLNRYLVEIITKECKDQPNLIKARLPFILAGIRTTPMAALGGLSPFTLETGRIPRTILDARLGVETSQNRTREHFTSEVLAQTAEGLEIAKRSREHIKAREQRLLDARTVTDTFKVGDLIMLRQPRDKASVAPRYSGPYPIVALVGTNQFVIEIASGNITVHMKDLKRYHGSAKPDTLVQRVEHAKSLQHDPTQWIAAPKSDQDALDATSIIGRRIRVQWPSLKRERDGLVTNRAGGRDGRHVVLYFEEIDNDPDPEFLEYLVGYSDDRLTKWQLLKPRSAPGEGDVAGSIPAPTTISNK
jgi:hypothetical protein